MLHFSYFSSVEVHRSVEIIKWFGSFSMVFASDCCLGIRGSIQYGRTIILYCYTTPVKFWGSSNPLNLVVQRKRDLTSRREKLGWLKV